MAGSRLGEAEPVVLIVRTAEASAASILRPPHAEDHAPMVAFGNPVRDVDGAWEHLAELTRCCRSGSCRLDLVQSRIPGGFARSDVIERQRTEVGRLSEQYWSLRVTLVWRGDTRAGRCSTVMPFR